MLQYQTVDTRCHPDNYDQYCTREDPSSVFDNNPLMPEAIFVNLVEDKPVTYNVNPGLPPRTAEIMFLLVPHFLAIWGFGLPWWTSLTH